MPTLEQICDDLIAEACYDEVGLWMIIRWVERDLEVQSPDEIRITTLDLVRRMLDSGRVEAGYYNPDGSGISRWKLPTSEVLSRIADEWTKLRRTPNIGDVVLFVRRDDGVRESD